MVLAIVALVVACTGSAAAAAFITSSDIRNNTIRSRDIRDNDVRGSDLRNGTVRGRDIVGGRVVVDIAGSSGATQNVIVGAVGSIDVACPSGTQALSGAYTAVDVNGNVPEGFTVTASFPLGGPTWRFTVINAGKGAVNFT